MTKELQQQKKIKDKKLLNEVEHLLYDFTGWKG